MANIHDVNESLQVQPSVRNLPTLIALSQGENGRSLQFRMVGATIPSGSSASLSGTKPDGVVYSKAGTVDGNTVIFQEDVQLTAVAGAWDAKIHIVNSGDSVATAPIRFIIDPDPVAAEAVPSDTQLDGIVAECKLYAEAARSNAYGSPLTASAAADMIDTSKVYVYTGSETGYTAGHWYYYNGSAWADGGVYNSIAIQTDVTLTLPDHAADAKATGNALATKADKIGNIALAERLYGGEYSAESEPYHFRQAPEGMGSKDETIVGGSLGWNQLVDPYTAGTTTNNGITFTYDGNGNTTLSGSLTAHWAYGGVEKTRFSFVQGHKYYLRGCPQGGSESTLRIWVASDTAFPSGHRLFDAGTGIIKDALANESDVTANIMLSANYSGDITKLVFTPQLFDLTACFGSTIADYIYSLETANAGAGVAWVRQYIDIDSYHEYCEPTLKSVEGLVSHDMVGFNQWDEEYIFNGINQSTGANAAYTDRITSKNYIPALPNTVYYFKGDASTLFYVDCYDADKAFLGKAIDAIGHGYVKNETFTTLANTAYIRFSATQSTYGTTYNHDISINLSDPSKNGTYEPYEKHSYPLDSSIKLRGFPKLSDGKMYFDGDIYPPSGEVTRRYGERAYQSGDESLADAITDGTTTVYKLTTPTTETAQPFQSPMVVGATEEYVSDSVVPVGHESKYYEDVAKKVNGLPKDFSTLIAPTEVSYTATRNYSTGSYLIVKNQLYKVTSAISSGGTITPNSNVTATTIMAEILALA